MRHHRSLLAGLAVMAIAAAGLVLPGCGSSDASSDSGETQTVKVTRGNLMTTISSFGSISMPEQASLTFGSGGSINDLYTVSEVNVEFGDSVKEGDVLAKLDTTSLERTVKQKQADLRTAQINLEQATSETGLLKAQAAVESAEASLVNAEADLDDARTTDITDAEAAVRNAQADLSNAQLALEVSRNNAESSIEAADDQLSDAEDSYYDFIRVYGDQLSVSYISIQRDDLWEVVEQAQVNLDTAKKEAEQSVDTAQNNVARAEDTLRNAQQSLADVQPDSVFYQQKEAAVAQAKASLAQARDDLAYVEAGHDIELLQIQVDNAQAALDEALDQLKAATIVAPYDGVVAAVNAGVGDEVTPNDVIIHLVNTSDVEIDAAVDEVDVASVKVGQMAMVTLDALPDARLRGKVSAISPVATSQSGVVTYAITVEVQNADKYELKDGMSATITIMAMDAEGVLLVPSNAIRRTADGNVVDVVGGDGQTEERAVETGATNGQQTEIVSGLEEGEHVLVHSTSVGSETTQKFGPGGGMRPPDGMRPPM